jgi:hypothetical protein
VLLMITTIAPAWSHSSLLYLRARVPDKLCLTSCAGQALSEPGGRRADDSACGVPEQDLARPYAGRLARTGHWHCAPADSSAEFLA